ncbi:MAG TPA: tetratricopeptide repeat protein, partial [Polyangia bacterium]
MVYQTDELARMRRQRSEQAIKAAMQSRWEEAVQLNQQIIEMTQGRDGDAFNRLGRALMAIGRYRDAREAYGRALQIDPTNQIARKNYASLQQKAQDEAPSAPRDYVDPRLFVEETGKTGVTALVRPQREALSHMTAGERVVLRRDGNQLFADNAAGDLLGQIEPRLALRLLR